MKKKIDYHKIFFDRMTFGFTTPIINKFCKEHFNTIDPKIQTILKFVDDGELIPDKFKEDLKIRCVCLLPFLLIHELLEIKSDSSIDMKKSYKQTLDFLNFIKYNKGYCNHLISKTTSNKRKPQIDRIDIYDSKNNPKTKKEYPPLSFDDFVGFDIEKINNQIEIHTFLSKTKSRQREWYSNILEFHLLIKGLELTKIGSSKIGQFISDLTKRFTNCHIQKSSIVKNYLPYKKKFKHNFANLNPSIESI